MTAGPDDFAEIQPGMVLPLPDDAAALAALERLSTIDLGVAAPTVTALGSLTRAVAFVAGVQGNAYPRPFLSTRVLLLTGSHSGGVVAGPTPEPRTGLPLQHLAVTAGAGIVTLEWQPASAAIEFEDAITDEQMDAAMRAGWAEADRAADEGIELIVLAAGGAGAATAAAAVVAAITGAEPPALLSPGRHPVRPLRRQRMDGPVCGRPRRAAPRPRPRRRPTDDPHRTRRHGYRRRDRLLLGAATRRTPVMIDGPVGAAAALLANDLALQVRRWILLPDAGGHPAVRLAAEALELRPWLDLRLDLGEGAAALAALPMLQTALTLAGVGAPAEALPPTRYDTSGNQVFVGVAKPVEPAIVDEDVPDVPPFGPPDSEDAATFTASTLETAPVGAADAQTPPTKTAQRPDGAKVPTARKEAATAPPPVKAALARATGRDTTGKDSTGKDTTGRAPTAKDSATAAPTKDAAKESPTRDVPKDAPVKETAGRDTAAKEVPGKDTAAKDTAAKDTAAKDTIAIGSGDERPSATPTTISAPKSAPAKSTDKPSTADKPATHKAATDKPTAEKPTAEKPAAKPAQEKPTAAKPSPPGVPTRPAPMSKPETATPARPVAAQAKTTTRDATERKASSDEPPKQTTSATSETTTKQIPGKATAAAKDAPRSAKPAEPGRSSAATPAGTAAKPAQPQDHGKGMPAKQRTAPPPAESKPQTPTGTAESPTTGKPAPERVPAGAEASSAKSAQTPAQRSAGSTPTTDTSPKTATPAPSGAGKSGSTTSDASRSDSTRPDATRSGGAKPGSTTSGTATSTGATSRPAKPGSSGAGTPPPRPRKQT